MSLLIFNRALDFADTQRVGWYLEQKYGIAGTHVNPQHADIGLGIATDAYRPAPGVEAFTYTIAVTNFGPTNATGIAVTDVLPAGLSHVSDTGAGDYVPRKTLPATTVLFSNDPRVGAATANWQPATGNHGRVSGRSGCRDRRSRRRGRW